MASDTAAPRFYPPLSLAWTFKVKAQFKAMAHQERAFLVVEGGEALVCIENGKELWRCHHSEGPALHFSIGGVVVAGRQVLTTVSSGGSEKDVLLVVDLDTGEVVRSATCDFSLSVPLFERGGFVGVGHFSLGDPRILDIGFVDLETLESRWEAHSRGTRENTFSFDMACGDDAVFLAKGKRLVALDLETGAERWSAGLEEYGGARPDAPYPMVSEGRVVVRTDRGTAALDAATGKLLWHVKADGRRAIYGGRVYVAGSRTVEGDDLAVVDLVSGEVLLERNLADLVKAKWGIAKWERRMWVGTGIVVSDTHFFLGDGDGRLYGFEKETAEPVWYHLPKGSNGYQACSPTVEGNKLYLVTAGSARRPGALYCYESEMGSGQ